MRASKKSTKVVVTILMLMMGLVSSSSFAQIHNLQAGKLEDEPMKQRDDKIYSSLFRASNIYLAGATVVDMTTTARVMSHPTMAYQTNGTLLGGPYRGVEAGWASFLGTRNTGAAVAANGLLNAGVTLLSQRIYRKGGRWRALAIGINVAKATGNLVAGVHNMQVGSTFDRRVRAKTGYQGRIVWSDK